MKTVSTSSSNTQGTIGSQRQQIPGPHGMLQRCYWQKLLTKSTSRQDAKTTAWLPSDVQNRKNDPAREKTLAKVLRLTIPHVESSHFGRLCNRVKGRAACSLWFQPPPTHQTQHAWPSRCKRAASPQVHLIKKNEGERRSPRMLMLLFS